MTEWEVASDPSKLGEDERRDTLRNQPRGHRDRSTGDTEKRGDEIIGVEADAEILRLSSSDSLRMTDIHPN